MRGAGRAGRCHNTPVTFRVIRNVRCFSHRHRLWSHRLRRLTPPVALRSDVREAERLVYVVLRRRRTGGVCKAPQMRREARESACALGPGLERTP